MFGRLWINNFNGLQEDRMEVHVAGDVHCPIDIQKLNTLNWPEQKQLTKDDLLIVLGDMGLVWAQDWDKEELYWAKWFTAKKCTVCYLDGNHENHPRLLALPVVDFHGGKAGVVYSDKNGTIYHLKRGEIYDFGGNKVLVVGGATSWDKSYRAIGISWWPEEELSKEDEENIIKNLELVDYKVDHILTHECPTNIAEQLMHCELRERGKTVAMMDFIQRHVSRKSWHFGHHHTSRGFDGNYICHYNWSPYHLI
jgi:hypothetical protein